MMPSITPSIDQTVDECARLRSKINAYREIMDSPVFLTFSADKQLNVSVEHLSMVTRLGVMAYLIKQNI